ncbi:methyltransferase domain-containing protein (plasmid) [Azospirillum sp. TSA2s]|uniref:methyltransferase n=1 Tax=Azospirillum sp. TSA2s TaxID=709810 RepID=UPI0010AA16AD|nr:methyltransferase [Azospirillum sp. TSA2s]QCG93055.1 methyltransferase domain-containing protein [Azospirillum sp. TSA2s]
MTIGPQDVRHALEQCQAGRPDDAERLYRGFVAQGSFSVEAMAPLGELARSLGLGEEAAAWAGRAVRLLPGQAEGWVLRALTLIAGSLADAGLAAAQRALIIAPGSASALRAVALARLRQNRVADAESACGEALAAQPGYAEGLATLALVRMAQGRAAEADTLFRQATAGPVAPAEAFGNHAALLARLGQDDEALERAERAVALRPRLASAQYLIGTLHRRAGRHGEAAARFTTAVAADPRHREARLALLTLLAEAGRLQEAAALGDELQSLAADDAAIALQLGGLFLRHGRADLALPSLRRALRLAPGTAQGWTLFARALRGVRPSAADADLRAQLVAAFSKPGVDPADLTAAAAGLLAADPAAARLLEAAADADAVEALLCSGALTDLAGDALLHVVLTGAPIADLDLERLVTAWRRALLRVTANPSQPLDESSWGQPWLGLCARLARQAFLGEYVLAESGEEAAAVGRLDEAVRHRLTLGQPVPNHWIPLLGAYRPLGSLPPALMGHSWPEDVRALLALQVVEPQEEAQLAAELPALTPICDDVSVQVRAQYEENPYPRWAATGLREAPLGLSDILHGLFPRTWRPATAWTAPEVLIAGCGTGREAIWAARHIEGARVLAVDLSRRSLAYGLRQSRRLGIEGLSFAQADLLELDAIGRRFDLIHSVGVLHHTADALAGLRVLTGLLAPGGVMKLGFYSALARRPLQAVRAIAAERRLKASPDGIRRLRQDILALPAGHPARAVTTSPDFFSASGCRDLMLHVHERPTTLPWLEQALDGLGLSLLGFEFDDPAAHRLYRRRFPEDPDMASLARWTRLEEEEPALFGRLYQFWVTRRG